MTNVATLDTIQGWQFGGCGVRGGVGAYPVERLPRGELWITLAQIEQARIRKRESALAG